MFGCWNNLGFKVIAIFAVTAFFARYCTSRLGCVSPLTHGMPRCGNNLGFKALAICAVTALFARYRAGWVGSVSPLAHTVPCCRNGICNVEHGITVAAEKAYRVAGLGASGCFAVGNNVGVVLVDHALLHYDLSIIVAIRAIKVMRCVIDEAEIGFKSRYLKALDDIMRCKINLFSAFVLTFRPVIIIVVPVLDKQMPYCGNSEVIGGYFDIGSEDKS